MYLYTYDDLDRVTELRLKDSEDQEYVLYRYEYDQEGNLSAVHDIREDTGRETIVTRFYYDMSGRLIYTRNDQDEDYRYTYDLNNNLVKVGQGNQFRLFTTEYTYDKDNRETATKTPAKTFATEYDGLGRIKSRNWNTTAPYEVVYEYQAGAGGAGSTSSQVSKVTAGGEDTSYEYDANGNITRVTTSDGSIRYAYDELNQLIREDNPMTGQTIGYVYDGGGNLLEKRIFAYLPDKTIAELKETTPVDTVTYTYDSEFKDLLTGYDGDAITYDEIGNPLTYRGMTFTWKKGRELNQVQKSGKTYTYRYDVNGMRNRKYLDDGTILYQMDGNQIIGEQKINNAGNLAYELEFIYDSSGNILAMMYNGEEYYYVRNLQGDVVGILNSQGTQVVKYEYDTWGKETAVNHGDEILAEINPFRYRGYYYDDETGFYYLKGRYYDPEVGRFISADGGISGVGGDIQGYNLFAYCFNNPLNMDDPTGNWPKWAKIAVGVVAAAAAVAVTVATLGAAAPAAVCSLTMVGTSLGISYGVASTVAAVAVAATVATAAVYAGNIAYSAVTRRNPLRDTVFRGNQAAYDTGLMLTSMATAGVLQMAAQSPGVCFVAGTPVLTASGRVAIEDIEVGDFVWAENPETGEKGLKEVVQTYVNETEELVHVFVKGEEIVTTPEHPFYAPKKGWVGALHLRAGDILVLQSGEYVVIEMIQHEILESPVTVYNFEVADWHTYYVGNSAILVHNECDSFSSRGSTAKRQPSNLLEQLALEQVKSNPQGSVITRITMSDPRWPASEGWIKMQQIVPTSQGDINIHYLYNPILNIFDDFKIK